MLPKNELDAHVITLLINQYEDLCEFCCTVIRQADDLACRVLKSTDPRAAEIAQQFRSRYLVDPQRLERFESAAIIARDILLDDVPRWGREGIEGDVSERELQAYERSAPQPVRSMRARAETTTRRSRRARTKTGRATTAGVEAIDPIRT